MGDNYGEVVELGITGIDRLVDKYYDAAYTFADKKAHFKRKKDTSKSRHTRSQPPMERHRYSQPSPEHLDRYNSNEEFSRPRNMCAQDNGRDADWRGYEYDARDGPYYGLGAGARGAGHAITDTGAVAVRGRDGYGYAGGYEVAPRAPSPPPPGYAARPYDARYEDERPRDQGRPPARRRPSSYSPPRRSDRHDSSSRHGRCKSPSRNRMVATVAGALAGGFVGNAVRKGDTLTTVAGAVVGGLGAREIEKRYDRHGDKRAEAEAEAEARRGQRRRERELEREYEWR